MPQSVNSMSEKFSKRRLFFILTVFLLVLLGLRMLWYNFRVPPPHPPIQHGTLDLRDWNFNANRAIHLNGEWAFYPGRLMDSGVPDDSWESNKAWIQVPGKWNSHLKSEFGYGTYRLRVLVSDTDQLYGLRMLSAFSSSRVYVNGDMLKQMGSPSEIKQGNTEQNIPYTVFFHSGSSEIEIIVQVSNFTYPGTGGIYQSMLFGSAEAVSQEQFFSETMQVIVCVVMLLHAIYAVILFFLGYRNKGLIYFTGLIFVATLSVLTEDDRLLLTWLPLNFEWASKIRILIYMGVGVFLMLCTKSLLGHRELKKTTRIYLVFCSISILTAIVLPLEYVQISRRLLLAVLLGSVLIISRISLIVFRKGEKAAFFILLSAMALTINIVVGGFLKARFWPDMPYYPLDLIVAFLGFAGYWFIRFMQTSIEATKLADDLRAADKMKDDFLANTSHELRNPLHGMINMAQTVLDHESDKLSGNNRENLRLIVTVGKRMSLLLNDLLDAALLHERDIRLNKQNVQLQGVVTGVFDMLRYMTEGKSLELANRVPEQFPQVTADENRLVQIMFNLVHNAIKYTNKGVISVEAHVKGSLAVIQVKDSGIGMTEKTRQRIFRRYEQGETGTSMAGGGLGLGLNICKQLIELHGGILEVDSVPDQGSVFTFTLPLGEALQDLTKVNIRNPLGSYAEAAATTEPERPIEPGFSVPSFPALQRRRNTLPGKANRPRILTVDDDPVNLKILSNLLSNDGYEIHPVAGGKEALEKLKDGEWDLIIVDVMMPLMSGYELTRMIRDKFPISELPILLLTARSRPEDIHAGFAAGANEYVNKPVDSVDLKARVASLIELKQSVHERLRMEAAWLHAQIQPHFLFNTLNSIASLSESDPSRMIKLLDEFGNYLQMSFHLKNLKQVIPLEEELALVRSYLYIKKERFGERLGVEWEIPESVQAEIPPFSLQTLVENAVRHGLLARASGGTVTIRVKEERDNLTFAVQDDGMGIAEEKLELLLTGTEGGIGLINTDRRLKQIYGRGLNIHSVKGEGTIVSFAIPKLRQGDSL